MNSRMRPLHYITAEELARLLRQLRTLPAVTLPVAKTASAAMRDAGKPPLHQYKWPDCTPDAVFSALLAGQLPPQSLQSLPIARLAEGWKDIKPWEMGKQLNARNWIILPAKGGGGR